MFFTRTLAPGVISPVFFFTRSSAANIPVNLRLCEKLGLSKNTFAVSIPLGATINMDGTAIMQGVATVFIANLYGIDLVFNDFISIIEYDYRIEV